MCLRSQTMFVAIPVKAVPSWVLHFFHRLNDPLLYMHQYLRPTKCHVSRWRTWGIQNASPSSKVTPIQRCKSSRQWDDHFEEKTTSRELPPLIHRKKLLLHTEDQGSAAMFKKWGTKNKSGDWLLSHFFWPAKQHFPIWNLDIPF